MSGRYAWLPIRYARAPQRGSPRRGVSPIIAMILLVAMVVVLAAVLYTLVGGLAQGPNKVPLGTALALGPAVQMSGSTVAASYCAVGHMCYSVPVAEARGSLTIGYLALSLTSPNGALLAVGNGTGGFSVANISGGLVAHSPSIPAGSPLFETNWTFSAGYSLATVLSSSLVIWLDFGTGTASLANHGYTLVVAGTGPYEGVVDVPLP